MPEQIENHQSGLLSPDENNQVFKLLGNRCLSLATAVVQLYTTKPGTNHSTWIKKGAGILCFVKDNIQKNYFFRLHCLIQNKLIYEQELYNNLEYLQSTNFLHAFEGDGFMVGFNFADISEANYFYTVVTNKIEMRNRRNESKSRQQINARQTPNYDNTVTVRNKERKTGRRHLTKADIGTPTDFKHISHVGWSEDSGFDINTEDQQLKKFFDKAGVSEKQLQDRETREFIYDFINKHGGRDAVAEVNDDTLKRTPIQSTPVPPVPPRGSQRPHTRAAPPPPPTRAPTIKKEKLPTPVAVNSNSYNNFAPPAPPPPPPPMDISPMHNDGAPPPPPPIDNSALMSSIRNGTSLKPVEDRVLPAPQDDARGNLLNDIRKGLTLKPVAEREVSAKPIIHEKSTDLAGALARALADRKAACHSEDDDDDGDDSNDDEWDDD